MLPFALTIFLSAFLLFLVQPLLGKYILPWFGGSPGVWTACLLFFQTVLLGGYAYAHWLTTHLTPRRQAFVHLALLAAAVLWLPVIPAASWKPGPGDEPLTRILLLLSACVGLPYLALSATGPLLQRWFSLAHPGTPPYRLYALSNTGSLLALLAYPFLLEPAFSRTVLGWSWSAAFAGFAVLCGLTAWRMRHTPPDAAAQSNVRNTNIVAKTDPAFLTRSLWVALPAAASVLLLATTNKLCLDVAVVPFLWVLPLALYLVSFILCFDHPRWYSRGIFAALLTAGCGVVAWLNATQNIPITVQAAGYCATLFAGCMVCHGELFRLRPPPDRLTGFYLAIAAGGALGSLLVAVAAPLVLPDYLELQIGLTALLYLLGMLVLFYRAAALARGAAVGAVAALLLVPLLRAGQPFTAAWPAAVAEELCAFGAAHWPWILAGLGLLYVSLRDGLRPLGGPWRRRESATPFALSLLLAALFIIEASDDARTVIAGSRNFYGTLKVRQYHPQDPAWRFNLLAHGATSHGLQFTDPPRASEAASYYSGTSGVGRILDLLPAPRRVGVVGLGTGTLAAYGLPGDHFRFYDINPDVIRLARRHFSYLERSVAGISLALGDARLVLEAELAAGDQPPFDLLVLDAFSSDAIPVHLLTREAVELYLRRLKPDGVLAFHLSNRHLRLEPVVEGHARRLGLTALTIEDDPPADEWWRYPTTWMLLSRDRARLTDPGLAAVANVRSDTEPAVDWTDDHASLLEVLR